MGEFKQITLVLITGQYKNFIGKYLPERERPNWHYYQEKDGTLIHCRKEWIVMVIEKELEDADGQLAD